LVFAVAPVVIVKPINTVVVPLLDLKWNSGESLPWWCSGYNDGCNSCSSPGYCTLRGCPGHTPRYHCTCANIFNGINHLFGQGFEMPFPGCTKVSITAQ